MVREDYVQFAEVLARLNGHPDAASYGQRAGEEYDRMSAKPTPLAGMQVLTDPNEWPKPVADTDIAV